MSNTTNIPLTVRTGFAQSSEYRVLELSEDAITALAEGCPHCPSKKGATTNEMTLGQKRTRDEGEEGESENESKPDAEKVRLAFTIRGDDDEVMICTHKATYALRRHEFSNNFYLVTSDTHSVHEKVNFVCEVYPTRPRLETIRALVMADEDAYVTLEEAESWGSVVKPARFALARRPSLLTFDQIVERSLCSRTEVAKFLISEGAMLIDNRVRFLHPALAYQILETAIHEVHRRAGDDETDSAGQIGQSVWSLNSFVLEELVLALSSLYPKILVRSALSTVVEGVHRDGKEENENQANSAVGVSEPTSNEFGALSGQKKRHGFIKKKILVAIAEGLLNPAITNPNTSPMGTQNLSSPLNNSNKKAFLASWREKIGVLTSPQWLAAELASEPSQEAENSPQLLTDKQMLEMIGGLAFTNNDTNSTETEVLCWCPHWRLPIELLRRITYLFTRKSRWPAGELRAFLTPCLEVGQNYDHAISKYCREIRSADKSVESTFIAV